MTRIQQTLGWLLAIGLAANALWMLAEPRLWYDTIPGVSLTGGFNQHFVRDIGCAYLATAAGLAWRARTPAAWPAAMLGAGFLLLHGGLHVADLSLGRCTPAGFLRDAPSVILPALLALWVAWPMRASRFLRATSSLEQSNHPARSFPS